MTRTICPTCGNLYESRVDLSLIPISMPLQTKLADLPPELALTARPASAFKYDEIITLEQLTRKTETELLRIPNFGRKSLNEVKLVLSLMGLSLAIQETSSADYSQQEHEKTAPADSSRD